MIATHPFMSPSIGDKRYCEVCGWLESEHAPELAKPGGVAATATPPQNTPALLLNEACGALERLLGHAGIADAHYGDIDREDHLAESSARAVAKRIKEFLSSQGVSEHAMGASSDCQHHWKRVLPLERKQCKLCKVFKHELSPVSPVSGVEEKQDSGEKEDLDLPGATNTR